MKQVLFIEPEGIIGAQGFYPEVIYWLSRIVRETPFETAIIGEMPQTALNIFKTEKIELKSAHEILPQAAVNASYTVGNSKTAREFSKHNNIELLELNNWQSVFNCIKGGARKVSHKRNTKETQITVEVNLDGTGKAEISTGLNFLDHMLDQIARHGNIDLKIKATGDLHIDEHHTMEDTAITIGEAMLKALGDKRGIERYGFCLPMDDALAQVAIDFGGRNWIEWNAEFKREKIGDVPTEMFFHFFKSFSDAAKCNLNIKAEGTNEHHKIEAIFKAFAKAIKMAVRRDLNNMQLPSTKGVL